jgi:hypothetical protein
MEVLYSGKTPMETATLTPTFKPNMEITEQNLFPDFMDENQLPLWNVQKVERKGALLIKNPVTPDTQAMALQLTAHPLLAGKFWPFPFLSRAGWRQPSSVTIDTARSLRQELLFSPDKPKAVYLNPVGDPFHPSLTIQAEVADAVEELAKHGIQSWLMTRGLIRPAILQRLTPFADRVQIRLGITTTESWLQRPWEPFCASPLLRLKQIPRWKALGFTVQVALEPLIPGITDTRENLAPLLEMLGEMGITRVTAGYLYLPQRMYDALLGGAQETSEDSQLADLFRNSTLWRTGALANCRLVPRSIRQQGYAALMALASHYGIKVGISSASNPDFTRRN